MAGNHKRGMLLQPRDRRLLSALGQIRILDRELAKIVAGFGSTTRCNARLLQLTRAGLLSRFFLGTVAAGRKAIYTLSRKGAALVEADFRGIKRSQDKNLVGDLFVQHQLALAEAFVVVMFQPIPAVASHTRRWLTFTKPPIATTSLIPDGYFELVISATIRPVFLEIDRGTETLKIWQKKVSAYVQIAASGEFSRKFQQQQFQVLIVTESERRMHSIRTAIAKTTNKIFWLTTFQLIHREGFWSAVWFRPTGDLRQSLL